MPLSDLSGGKARLEDDPEARRPAVTVFRANDFVGWVLASGALTHKVPGPVN